MTLLQKALQTRKRKPYAVYKKYGVQDYELVSSWLKGEISVGDVCVAIGKERNQSPSGYSYIALVIRAMMDQHVKTRNALLSSAIFPTYFQSKISNEPE